MSEVKNSIAVGVLFLEIAFALLLLYIVAFAILAYEITTGKGSEHTTSTLPGLDNRMLLIGALACSPLIFSLENLFF